MSTKTDMGLPAAFGGGILGIAVVLAGSAFQVPGFSPRSGYWGTHWLDGFLYGIGSDTVALTVICGIWFVLGAVIGGFLGYLFSALLEVRGRSDR
jgi:hypothetical protein